MILGCNNEQPNEGELVQNVLNLFYIISAESYSIGQTVGQKQYVLKSTYLFLTHDFCQKAMSGW